MRQVLLLGECRIGATVDWELLCGAPRAAAKMLDVSLERLAGGEQDRTPHEIGGDRGFDSQANRDKLEANLKKRMKESDLVALQQWCQQTETRKWTGRCRRTICG